MFGMPLPSPKPDTPRTALLAATVERQLAEGSMTMQDAVVAMFELAWKLEAERDELRILLAHARLPGDSLDAFRETAKDFMVECFRLLKPGEVICEGDEFLEGDTQTFKAFGEMWWGAEFDQKMLKPVRRKVIQQ